MKTADPELMRAINRFHVMDAIRRFGPVSRVEISQSTELSATTVSAITAALLDDRLIIPCSSGRCATRAAAGRGSCCKLNPDAAYVVGVKLAPDQITVAVTNFCADILRSLAMPIRIDRQTAAVIADLVEDGIRRCVSDADLEIADISGVCVGLPGVVERAAGVCRQSPIFQRARRAVRPASERNASAFPASIDSDVNLVTLAEHWFGQARDLNDFLVVSVERSLGLGILHNGDLFRGANGLSPDLGDLMVRPPRSGGGRLADVGSETSVLTEAEAFLRDGEHVAAFRAGRGMALLLQRAAEGDGRAARVLAAAGEAVGFAIANLIALFAPPKVIVSGRAMATSEYFIAPLRKTVAALLPASLADVSDIVVREWSDGNWVHGAAAMTLRDLYGAPWGTTGPAPIRELPAFHPGES